MYLDECDHLYEKDSPDVYKKIVLRNALFELDTLIYPTIMGMYYIHQIGNRYTFDGKLAVFFLKMDVSDLIDYEVRWVKWYTYLSTRAPS